MGKFGDIKKICMKMEKGQKTNGVFTLSASGPHPF